eukprot:TRINITY_DN5805_c0_g1_i1.p1 TRINITY_DN5805_c0_g1~~TRINITY_DN5805_c0_g1_i1.p1  ORF type:complete len:205 (-),score=43.31 TRINITY_DN5805_c0_g1_i1:79-693(-)
MTEIKAIALDLGGVLFSEGKSTASRSFTESGLDSAKILKVLSSPLSKDLRCGRIEDDEFWQYAQRELPDYDASSIKKIWYDSYILDEDIKNIILKLKGKFKFVAFSGNIRSRIIYLDSKYDFRKLFEVECYSYDQGSSKPSESFVKYMIEKSGCLPSEIIYVDDHMKDAAPAIDLGVNVIIYSKEQGIGLDKLKEGFKKHGIDV